MKPRIGVLIWTMLPSIVWGVATLPAALLAFTTIFMFDAPGSSESPITVALAGGFLLLPVICLLACIGGVIFSRGVRSTSTNLVAVVFALLPLVNIIYIASMWHLLDVLCAGQFVCAPWDDTSR